MQLQQVNRRRTAGFILAELIIDVAGAFIFALLGPRCSGPASAWTGELAAGLLLPPLDTGQSGT